MPGGKITIEPTKPDVIEVKTPLTGLLDMLAGWSEYVQTEEEAVTDNHVGTSELFDLYQEAGQLIEDEKSPDQEARDVQSFVEARVLPMLLRR